MADYKFTRKEKILKPKIFYRILSVVFWIVVWWILAGLIGNAILLPTPITVLGQLWSMLFQIDTWIAVGTSLLHILLGFFIATVLGIGMGIFAFHIPLAARLMEPLITFAKSVPIAAFIVLAMLWFGADALSSVIAVLVAFPILYTNTITGLGNRDRKLLEMAQVMHMPRFKRIYYIDSRAMQPVLYAGVKTAYGMCWKAAIAAEMIGIAGRTIGEELYMAKIYIETADLFAWMVLIMCCAWVSERILIKGLGILRKLSGLLFGGLSDNI